LNAFGDKRLNGDDAGTWLAFNLRATVFAEDLTSLRDLHAWHEVFGAEPETSLEQRLDRSLRRTGAAKEGRIVEAILPDRAEWIYVANPGADYSAATPPMLGIFTDVLPQFEEMGRLWARMLPPIRRMAFGAKLYAQIPEGATVSEEFVRRVRLPGLALPRGTSDLLLQLNSRRQSDVEPSLAINKLRKWLESPWQFLIGQATPLQVITPNMQVIETTKTIELELDINTAPEFVGNLPRDRVAEIWNELVADGQTIAQHGEATQ
jgi:hypothetical protein